MNKSLLENIQLNILKDKSDVNFRGQIFADAKARRLKLHLPIVAVTGSVGKTTVKDLLFAILNPYFSNHVFTSVKNHNTKIAIATQILSLSRETLAAVFEVGARRINDFEIPMQLLQPTIAVGLNIGTAHLGEFGNLENLVNTKLAAFKAESLKILVLNQDEKYYQDIIHTKSNKQVITFGQSPASNVQICHYNKNLLILRYQNIEKEITLSARLPKLDFNIAAAVATALAMGLSFEQALQNLKSFIPPERRFQKIVKNNNIYIDDSFNASIESYKVGLRLYAELYAEKESVLVIGEMLELGDFSKVLHIEIANFIKFQIIPLFLKPIEIVTVGKNANIITKVLNSKWHFDTTDDLLDNLPSMIKSNTCIYIKGSKNLKLNRIYQ